MFIIVDSRMRLCRDGKYRSFAPIGSESWCVKEYKSKTAALKAAKDKLFKNVVEVPDGFELDAAGRIYNDAREVPMESLIVKPSEVSKNPTSVQPLLFGGTGRRKNIKRRLG